METIASEVTITQKRDTCRETQVNIRSEAGKFSLLSKQRMSCASVPVLGLADFFPKLERVIFALIFLDFVDGFGLLVAPFRVQFVFVRKYNRIFQVFVFLVQILV